ncbi:MAG: hypothetical protein ACK5E6_03575, partial [Cyanobacteriota bacterium]
MARSLLLRRVQVLRGPDRPLDRADVRIADGRLQAMVPSGSDGAPAGAGGAPRRRAGPPREAPPPA